jgi:hypothetical protein
MNPETLLLEARRRGLAIESRGNKLAVIPSGNLTPDFEAVLRQHKRALIAYLNAQHLIKQVLASEFDGAAGETVVKLVRILKAARHPLARTALEHLLHEA